MRYFLTLLATLLILISCDQPTNKNALKSGAIEYKITYLENKMERVATPLLPKKMVLKFNQHKSISTIDGFFGFLKISNITDFKDERAKTLVKVFDTEYLFVGEKGEPICCYDSMEGIDFKITGQTKEFSGITGHEAIAYLPDGSEFKIFYTKDIDIKNPNATNPYAVIEGVLLDFQLTMSQLKMRFTAELVEPVEVDETEFEEYSDPKRINRESMSKVIDKLME